MTSTGMYQGLNETAKPSSKVLRPPGGASSDIFGTASSAAVASPSRGRAPASNNIFGGYQEPASDRPKHNRLASNVFEAEPTAAPVNAGDADRNKSDEEKDKENVEEENVEETAQNNNDEKAQPVKAKGDSVYNPITHGLNLGQKDSYTEDAAWTGMSRARGAYSRGHEGSFSIGAQEEHVPHSARDTHNQRAFSAQKDSTVFSAQPPVGGSPNRNSNADVSNPITGETKSFSIGDHHLAQYYGGGGEQRNKPSTRVVQPPGGASTPLW